MEDDYLILEQAKQNKKNEKKDEIVLSRVESIHDSISRIGDKADELDEEYEKKYAYYEKEMKLAEESCAAEIQRLREALDLKIQAVEQRRDSKINYYMSQLNIIKAKHEARKKTYDNILERKEKRLERTASKITTKKGQQALKNEIVVPAPAPASAPAAPVQPQSTTGCSKEERQAAQTYLQNGGSIHSLQQCFPNFAKEMKELEKQAEEKRQADPRARKAKEEAQLQAELEKEAEAAKEKIIGALTRTVETKRRQLRDLKQKKRHEEDTDEPDEDKIRDLEDRIEEAMAAVEAALVELQVKKMEYRVL